MVNPPTTITIGRIEKPEELMQCEWLQKEIWGPNELFVVPAHQLIAAVKGGGIVLGAFNPEGKLVGFCYGFIGIWNKKLVLHSHILGVLKAYRAQGIGYRLKLEQRKYALEQSIDLITWTFDPLESANANLNIHKLGGVSHKYYVNFYGTLDDELNQGLASDRLLVEWHLNSKRVVARAAVEEEQEDEIPPYFQITRVEKDKIGYLRLIDYILDRTDNRLLLQIPYNFQKLKQISIEAATEWRNKTRKLFIHYFSQGYVVTDFLTHRISGEPTSFYLLEKLQKTTIKGSSK